MLNNDRLFQKSTVGWTDSEPEGPRHLTSSQAGALGRLCDLASLQGMPEKAGVAVRNKPLLVGPSGAGKSAIVRRLAALEGLPLMVINAASWIVYGALTTPHTLTVIRRFVRSHARSIIFVDEIDKLTHGEAAFSHPWGLAVLAECLAILDSDKKLGVCGWKESDIEHLRKTCFIVGAGAWQLHAVEARREENLAYAERILDQAGIPEEVLFRFNARLIQILPPRENDFCTAIRRVRRELSLPILPAAQEGQLVKEALGSHRGMRWIEEYVADLLIANPNLCEESEEFDGEEAGKPAELKPQISRTEYQQRLDGALKMMAGLERPALELVTKMRLAQQIDAQVPSDEKLPTSAANYQPLIEALENYAPSLLYATCLTPAERYRRETELQIHGHEILQHLQKWLLDRPFTLRTHGLLETAISVQVMITRLLATWKFLASIEVEE